MIWGTEQIEVTQAETVEEKQTLLHICKRHRLYYQGKHDLLEHCQHHYHYHVTSTWQLNQSHTKHSWGMNIMKRNILGIVSVMKLYSKHILALQCIALLRPEQLVIAGISDRSMFCPGDCKPGIWDKYIPKLFPIPNGSCVALVRPVTKFDDIKRWQNKERVDDQSNMHQTYKQKSWRSWV